METHEDMPSARQEMLLREYESLVPQIIHWDSHFWTKSQFFLFIESAFVAVILQAAREQFISQTKPPPLPFIFFFLLAGLFNVFLCYVWFRTNRRNREYLNLRFERAREIESELGVLRTFTQQRENLPKAHGSASWETHLATVFIILWLILMISTSFLTYFSLV